ncbi:FG-GAP-like repeat-containing protein [Myxococcota bacterium]|nr:FG-GAP-like repeat-containing protein [Myxococcota bacterium]
MKPLPALLRRSALLTLLGVSGCVWISKDEHLDRIDFDDDGVVVYGYEDGTDCDDRDPNVTTRTFYRDDDGDGEGDPNAPLDEGCEPPSGYVATALDCDDNNAEVNPGQQEVCGDGLDNDCDDLPCLPLGELGAESLAVISGVNNKDLLGAAFDLAADFDGDGAMDLLVGAPNAAPGGAVYGLYGPLAEGRSASDADFTIAHGSTGVEFGASVAWLPGTAGNRLAVGVPGSIEGYGAVQIFDPDVGLSVATAAVVVQALDDIGLGGAMSAAGDLDGDGLGELLIAAPNYERSFGERGAWFIYGGASSSYRTPPNDDDGALLGSNNVHLAEMSPRWGDVDGDGVDEVAIGGSATDGDNGVVLLLTPIVDAWVPPTDALRTLVGSGGADQRFGAAVDLGDLDGDGRDDVVVGAPGDEFGAGKVYVFLSNDDGTVDSAASITVSGAALGDGLGEGVAASADLDGDGLEDVVVSRPGAELSGLNRGAVSVYLGLSEGGVLALEDADLTVIGATDSGELGTSLRSGLADADGFVDLLIGGPAIAEGQIVLLPAGPY